MCTQKAHRAPEKKRDFFIFRNFQAHGVPCGCTYWPGPFCERKMFYVSISSYSVMYMIQVRGELWGYDDTEISKKTTFWGVSKSQKTPYFTSFFRHSGCLHPWWVGVCVAHICLYMKWSTWGEKHYPSMCTHKATAFRGIRWKNRFFAIFRQSACRLCVNTGVRIPRPKRAKLSSKTYFNPRF